MNTNWNFKTPGIPDEYFIRGNVPMTKSEVRAVTMSKLKLCENHRVLDIGAGTGSITIEAGLIADKVTAIEINVDGVSLIKQNVDKFNLSNVEVVHGIAPDNIPEQKYDRVFIGGSKGNVESILDFVDKYLVEGGIVVANTITIENQYKIINELKRLDYGDIEIVQMNVSRSRNIGELHMMMAENGIAIISAKK